MKLFSYHSRSVQTHPPSFRTVSTPHKFIHRAVTYLFFYFPNTNSFRMYLDEMNIPEEKKRASLLILWLDYASGIYTKIYHLTTLCPICLL